MINVSSFVSIIGVLIAVALTIAGMVFLYLKILPQKLDGSFSNKFLQIIHDYFNFKKLYIESVLKFLFTLLTIICIAVGISAIVTSFLGIFQNIGYVIDYNMPFKYLISSFFGRVLGGVLTIVVGPIVVRLIYEGIMMFIILVKNVIEINNKTKTPDKKSEDTAE